MQTPRRSLLLATAVVLAFQSMAQLNVNVTQTPAQLVQNVLVGGGVSVSNVTFNGATVNSAQDGTGSFTNGSSTNLGLDAGMILSTGLANELAGPASFFASTTLGTGSDPDLLAITTPGNSINDKTIIEFDFVPDGDSLRFRYVFGSEEYPTFSCSPNFNDVFGFFLSGPGISGPFTNNAINIALVPGTNLPVSIANIHGNDGSGCGPANAQYYVNNAGGSTIALNGFTTVLTAEAAVQCGQTYHIKLAIGDAGDSAYDSAVFLEAGSFQSNVPAELSASSPFGSGVAVEGCPGAYFTIFRPAGTDSTVTVDFFFTGTATEGEDYPVIESPVTIPAGQDSVRIPFTPYDDGIEEGVETAILNVFMINACGDTITNSVIMAIADYPEMEIHTQTFLLLDCSEETIPLQATVTGGLGEVTMLWNDSLPGGQIEVSGMEMGHYTVSATDQCPRTVTETIQVDPGCGITIPNVITPNGDGDNDYFVVDGIERRNNSVLIWDRWGREVLNVSNYQNNFAARGLSDGVYYYRIRVLDEEYTGTLQILDNRR